MTFFDRFTAPHLIGAHRGFRALRPENTLMAFTASLGRCHFIEIDVQLTRDGVPVVIHDRTLKRTTDAPFLSKRLGLTSLKVSSWDLVQLKELDVGSWFLETDPFATLASGLISLGDLQPQMPQRIMTLTEILVWALRHKIPVNVEIKDQKGTKYDRNVVTMVLDVIQATGTAAMVLVSSFNHDYLFQCKALAPHLSVAVLQGEPHPPELIRYLQAIGASAYHPADAITDTALIRMLRPAGFGINVYTVNDRERRRQLFADGATAVITDFPELP